MKTNRFVKRANARYNAGHLHVFETEWVARLLTAAFIISDAVTLCINFRSKLAENILLLIVLTSTIALCIDTIPGLLGAAIRSKHSSKKEKAIAIISLVVIFTGLILLCGWLRWSTRGSLVSNSNLDIIDSVGTAGDESTSAIALLMAFSPLATSCILFFISLLNNPEQKERRILETQLIENRLEANNVKVLLAELEFHQQFDMEAHTCAKSAYGDQVLKESLELANRRSREALAMQLNTQAASDRLLGCDDTAQPPAAQSKSTASQPNTEGENNHAA